MLPATRKAMGMVGRALQVPLLATWCDELEGRDEEEYVLEVKTVFQPMAYSYTSPLCTVSDDMFSVARAMKEGTTTRSEITRLGHMTRVGAVAAKARADQNEARMAVSRCLGDIQREVAELRNAVMHLSQNKRDWTTAFGTESGNTGDTVQDNGKTKSPTPAKERPMTKDNRNFLSEWCVEAGMIDTPGDHEPWTVLAQHFNEFLDTHYEREIIRLKEWVESENLGAETFAECDGRPNGMWPGKGDIRETAMDMLRMEKDRVVTGFKDSMNWPNGCVGAEEARPKMLAVALNDKCYDKEKAETVHKNILREALVRFTK